MSESFNIIKYLAGLTGFVFDKDVLVRVAYDCGVSSVTDYSEVTDEMKDRCKIALLETVLESPHMTPSHTSKHGEWQEQFGSQTITSATLDNIVKSLRKLYKKYGMEEKLEELDDMDATIQWI